MKTSENPMKPTVIYGSRMVPKFLFAHPCETTVLKGSWGLTVFLQPVTTFHSYGHLSIITGDKWDYIFYKWGFLSTYNWYFGP